MPVIRRHVRVVGTQDLSARLRSPGRHEGADRVLNLSEGGVAIAGGELDVGAIVSFELSGPREFRFAGLAEVTHCSNRATGLRFLDADASSAREVEDFDRHTNTPAAIGVVGQHHPRAVPRVR